LPINLVPKIEAFVKKINKRFPQIPVTFQDERFTSEDAKKIILQSGVKKKKRRDKSLVDKVSAVLILEEYMQANRWQ